MRIGKKNFPYPVINRDISYSSFENTMFELKLEDDSILESNEKLVLKNIRYYLDNIELMSLINMNKIKIYCIVECSSTIFRKRFELFMTPINIEIDINDLQGRVEISAYGIINETIKEFSHENFNSFYRDSSFDMDRHNIILIDDGLTVTIEHKEEDDNKLSSIFSIIKKEGLKEIVEVDATSRKIVIALPAAQFDIYDRIKYNSRIQPIMFSMLLIPALLSELTNIRNEINENDHYSSIEDIKARYYWFASVARQYSNVYSSDLSLPIFKEIDLFLLSQKLVEGPVSSGINELRELLKGDEDSED